MPNCVLAICSLLYRCDGWLPFRGRAHVAVHAHELVVCCSAAGEEKKKKDNGCNEVGADGSTVTGHT